MVIFADACETLQAIELGNGCCKFLQPLNLLFDLFPDFDEQTIFQFKRLAFRSKNQCLFFFQFGRDESFGIDQSLFSFISTFRKFRYVCFRDFDIIAKYTVEPDFEVMNASFFTLACFQFSQPLLAVFHCIRVFIKLFIVSRLDHAAFRHRNRRFFIN